jgi:hypothetical protein
MCATRAPTHLSTFVHPGVNQIAHKAFGARRGNWLSQTSLMLRAAFKLPLRQTEGLLASVLTLMKPAISVSDHTAVSRCAVKLPVIQPAQVPHGALQVLIDSTGLQVYGAPQWLEAKHGAKSRRKWRKLHLAVYADSRMIVAQTLTDQGADDPSQVAPLLDQIGECPETVGIWQASI